jgi:hypothetical protein
MLTLMRKLLSAQKIVQQYLIQFIHQLHIEKSSEANY